MLNQAKEFNDSVGLTGIILTKLDGTARGGAVVSARPSAAAAASRPAGAPPRARHAGGPGLSPPRPSSSQILCGSNRECPPRPPS